MSSAFNVSQYSRSNVTFGVVQPNLYASNQTANKRVKTVFCGSGCNINVKSQGELLLKRRAKKNALCCYKGKFIDRGNLNSNLYTYENFEDVYAIETNSDQNVNVKLVVNPTVPFYQEYTIDPTAKLFGNTPCGLQNYLKYSQKYLPTADSYTMSYPNTEPITLKNGIHFIY